MSKNWNETRYIVVINRSEVFGPEVYAFGAFDTAFHFQLLHEHAIMYQVPDSGIGPCECLEKEEKSENDMVIARILRGSLEASLEKKVIDDRPFAARKW